MYIFISIFTHVYFQPEHDKRGKTNWGRQLNRQLGTSTGEIDVVWINSTTATENITTQLTNGKTPLAGPLTHAPKSRQPNTLPPTHAQIFFYSDNKLCEFFLVPNRLISSDMDFS